MYCIEESTCDVVGTFRRSLQWFDARWVVPPFVTTPGCKARSNYVRFIGEKALQHFSLISHWHSAAYHKDVIKHLAAIPKPDRVTP